MEQLTKPWIVFLNVAADTHSSVEKGPQAQNVAVGETSEYDVTVVEPTLYQGSDQSGQCVCRQRPLEGFDQPQSTETGRQHMADVGPYRHGFIDVHAQISDRLKRMNWVVAD